MIKRVLPIFLASLVLFAATSCDTSGDVVDDVIVDVDGSQELTTPTISLSPADYSNQKILTDERASATSYSDTYVELNGSSALTLTGDLSSILSNSIVKINSSDSRLFLPNISRDDWEASISASSRIFIGDFPYMEGFNAEVEPYYGCIYIKVKDDEFKPAVVYSGEESVGVERSTIYTGSDVPLSGNIDKILLKRGHQIVVAASEDGTKSSRCFVAVENDLTIELDETLKGQIQLMRVLAVDYLRKRGIAAASYLSSSYYPPFDFDWYYKWTVDNASASKDPDNAFLPMCNNSGSITEANFQTIIDQEYPLLMAFNEPDNKDQANMEVEDAITLYKQMHKLGVRLGSPSTEQVGNGSSDSWNDNADAWINLFMAAVEREGLRVDVMGVHWYDVGSSGSLTLSTAASASPTRLMNNLKQCYEAHGRPIILTEWNCGSYSAGSSKGYVPWEVNKPFLEVAVPKLEACEYVERYALFPPNGGTTSSGEVILNGIKGMMTGENGVWKYLTEYGEAYMCCESQPSIVLADDSL